jgi:hypothetical protein
MPRTIGNDARVFFGVGEHNTPSNSYRANLNFDNECTAHYGAEAWRAECNKVYREEMASLGLPVHEPKPDPMAKVLAELSKSRNFQRAAWAQVIEIGRKYAQMKLHGSYLERGGATVRVSFSETARLEEQFKTDLLYQVERAFLEDALMGVAIADAT